MHTPAASEQPHLPQTEIDRTFEALERASHDINHALGEYERTQGQADRKYSRGSARMGGFMAALSGVCSTLFVEALASGAGVETDIITATPAVGFGVMAAIVLKDALRTSEEAGAHQVRAEQYE